MARFSKDDWEALTPLLDEALELPPSELAAWLARHRISHPSLAAEVESLLRREPAVERDDFLGPGQAPFSPGVSSLAGQTLGNYVLDRLLGHGGMGSVWLARRNDGRFEGTVAIKFLSLAVAGPTGEARFRREGSVLARLTHPNIARLLDAGMTPEGQPYLVLEHVDGQPLDRWCDERRLSVEARLGLFLQVLGAVAHAHANLIVHRDLKPANILVTADGTVKLLDFGIARLLDDEEQARTALTGSHEAILTFQYAAPEQVRGEPVTTALDVYSLGVVLYELLSGQHPTSGRGHTPAEHVRAILETDPRPLSRAVSSSAVISSEQARELAESRGASPEKLRRLYRGDLDNILAKALRKSPVERYPSITELADDLQRCLRHEPVSARADAWSYRAARFVRRHRGAVTLAALTAMVLAGAATVTAFQAREARQQRDLAIYQSKRADAEVEFQNLLMSEVGDQPMTMREILDRGRVLLERQFGGDPRFLGTLLLQLASRYAELGDPKTESLLLARAESLALAGHGSERLTEIRCSMAENRRTTGSYEEAMRLLDGADSILAGTPDDPAAVLCLQTRAAVDAEIGRPDSSLAALRRAVAIKVREGDTRDQTYLGLLGSLADALASENQFRESIEVSARGLAGMDSSGRGGMMARVIMQHNMALVLLRIGETRQAEAVLHDVLLRAGQGSPDGVVANQPLIHYAETALYQGHADSAVKYFGRLRMQAVRDTNLYWEGRAIFGQVRAQLSLGQVDSARLGLARFRQIEAHYGHVKDTDDQLADSLSLAGMMALATGDTAAAGTAFGRMLRDNGFFEGKRQRLQRPVALLAGEAALASGRFDDAIAHARKALEIAAVDSLSRWRSAYVGDARHLEGRALLRRGDTTAARPAIAAAVAALTAGAGIDHPNTVAATRLLASIEARH